MVDVHNPVHDIVGDSQGDAPPGDVEDSGEADAASGCTSSDRVYFPRPLGSWSFEQLTRAQPGDTTTHCSLAACRLGGGILHGAVRHVPGRHGRALAFGAGSGHVEIPHHEAMLLGRGTITMWFNAHNVTPVQGLFSKDARGLGTGGHLDMRIRNAEVEVRFQRIDGVDGERDVSLVGAGLVAGKWHHLAFVFDATGRTLYLDGVLVDQDTEAAAWGLGTDVLKNLEPIALGMSAQTSEDLSLAGSGSFLGGLLDEVAIYDRALAPAQIEMLQHWRFDHDAERLTAHATVLVGDQPAALTLDLNTLSFRESSQALVWEPSLVNQSFSPLIGERGIFEGVQTNLNSSRFEMLLNRQALASSRSMSLLLNECFTMDLSFTSRMQPGMMPRFEVLGLPVSLPEAGAQCATIEAVSLETTSRGQNLWLVVKTCDQDARQLLRLNNIGGQRPAGAAIVAEAAPYGQTQVRAIAMHGDAMVLGSFEPAQGFRICDQVEGCLATPSYGESTADCPIESLAGNRAGTLALASCYGDRRVLGLVRGGNVGLEARWQTSFESNFPAEAHIVTRFVDGRENVLDGLAIVGRDGDNLTLRRYRPGVAAPEALAAMTWGQDNRDRLRGLASGDVNFDGIDDFFITVRNTAPNLIISNLQGDFTRRALTTSADVPSSQANRFPSAGDFVGDGRASFIATRSGARTELLVSHALNHSPFVTEMTFDLLRCGGVDASDCVFAESILWTASVDIDGDGLDDIVVATFGELRGDGSEHGPRIFVLRNTGLL
ncbi:MAG: LamG domain-containing protein [Bradymonadaceae bacterium]|nr:LamG domain-containing protein [Lujinxingiaceae bacterium]